MMAKTMPPRLPAAPVRPERIPVIVKCISEEMFYGEEWNEDCLTIGKWMDVRDKSKVRTITGFMEKRHASNQAEECWFVVRVGNANRNQEDTRRHADEMDPKLLRPQRMCVLVNNIRDDTPYGTREHIEQPKHSRPPPTARLAEL